MPIIAKTFFSACCILAASPLGSDDTVEAVPESSAFCRLMSGEKSKYEIVAGDNGERITTFEMHPDITGRRHGEVDYDSMQYTAAVDAGDCTLTSKRAVEFNHHRVYRYVRKDQPAAKSRSPAP